MPAPAWMDVDGLSPIHHENFDWSALNDPTKRAEKIGGIWYKKGSGWGAEENRSCPASRSTRT